MSSGRQLVRRPPTPPMEVVRSVAPALAAAGGRLVYDSAGHLVRYGARRAGEYVRDAGGAFIQRLYNYRHHPYDVPGRFRARSLNSGK